MRSVLVELGPWQWPAILVIAAILFAVVLVWRRFERAMGEEPQPIDARWFAVNGLLVAAVSVGLYLAVNAFGPVKIRSYGVCLLLGFIGGYSYALKVGQPRGLPATWLLDMMLLQLVSAVIGARGMFVLLALKDYAADPGSVVDVWQGGLSFHGGLLGALIATVFFTRYRRIRFAVLADICTPGITIGYAVTRVGCFLNGCCHGNPTDGPLGVVMPETGYTMHLHPTQLYASAGSALLFFILRWAWPRMHRPGQLFPLYMMLYSVMRYLCEMSRIGWSAERSGLIPALSVAQVACIAIAVVGLAIYIALQRLPYESPTEAGAMLPSDPEPDSAQH